MPFVTLPVDGGLDLVTPPVSVNNGRLQACQNFEVALNQGIRSIDGFERFDGGPSPTYLKAWSMAITGINNPSTEWTQLDTGAYVGGAFIFSYQVKGQSGPKSVSATVVYTATTGNTTGIAYFVTQNQADSAILLQCLAADDGYSFFPPLTPGPSQVDAFSAGAGAGGFPFSSLTKDALFATNQASISAQSAYYGIARSTIQEVPGQGNVNGLFWLKDYLYATRDYLTLAYNATTSTAAPGNELFIGASYAAATWTGFLATNAIDSATSGTGASAGSMMFYNTTGTPSTGVIKNHSAGDVAVATITSITAPAQGAGLYKAVGGRGSDYTTQSWQHQDLGYHVRYKNNSVLFSPANRAAPLTDLEPLIQTTEWVVADLGNGVVTEGGWSTLGGVPLLVGPLSVADGDAWYVAKGFASASTSASFWIKNFGLTDADVPDGALITGIEIEVQRRSYRNSAGGSATGQIRDASLQLKFDPISGVGGTANFADLSSNWLQSTTLPDNVYETKTYGGKQSLLGYTGVSSDSIKTAAFGFSMSAKCIGYAGSGGADVVNGAQSITAHVTLVRLRVHFVPAQSKVYFWNVNSASPTAVAAEVVQAYKTGGTVSAGDAKGHLFVMAVGTPSRQVGADEQIRTYPANGGTPNGGPGDGSILIALTETSLTKNVMDWSSMLNKDGTAPNASKYQYDVGNFTAVADFEAIYGVSGAGPAFMYDGYAFTRMYTGVGAEKEDIPRHVRVHQNRLWLGFRSGVVVYSEPGNPLGYDALNTAGYISVSAPIRGLMKLSGDTLAQLAQTGVYMIQGDVAKGPYAGAISPDVGCVEYTGQSMGQYMYTSFRGIQNMRATQAYGDFDANQFSWDVWSWLRPRVQTSAFFQSANIGVINSLAVRNKAQYRLMFADGYQLTGTFLREGEMPQYTIQYYVKADGVTPHTWDAVTSGVESNGRDRLFGSTNDGTGYVYEIDSGKSFDGANIKAFATLVLDDQRAPETKKQYTDIVIHGIATGYASFNVSRSTDYAVVDKAQNYAESFGSLAAVPTGTEAYYSSASPLSISGRNIAIRFDRDANDQYPITIQAVSYYTIPNGDKRS